MTTTQLPTQSAVRPAPIKVPKPVNTAGGRVHTSGPMRWGF